MHKNIRTLTADKNRFWIQNSGILLGGGILSAFRSWTALGIFLSVLSIFFFIKSFESLTSLKTASASYRYAGLALGCAAVSIFGIGRTPELSIFMALAIGVILTGGVIGALLAQRVQMTQLPQLMAIFHSLVGLAAMLLSWVVFSQQSRILSKFSSNFYPLSRGAKLEILFESILGIMTCTGSLFSFARLQGKCVGKITFSLFITLLTLGGLATVMTSFIFYTHPSFLHLCLVSVTAAVLGVLWILPIGGADMPLVISLLNSLSGWTCASLGMFNGFPILTIVGILVGFSGAVLTRVMCQGMNKSLWKVFFGTFSSQGQRQENRASQNIQTMSATDAAFTLEHTESVVIIPGYGMAVSQAQQTLQELCQILKKKGIDVSYGLHPVAGRMPGHMDVLLAQADVAPEDMHDLDVINRKLPTTDIVLIIGANDTVNPSAETDPESSIYKMPIFQVSKAKKILFIKRSLGQGYAGVDNPLMYNPKTFMILGDARKVCEEMLQALSH